MLNNIQRALGYREVVYNIRNDEFWTLDEGDNYSELNVSVDSGPATASNFTFDASIIPDTNAAYDLGSAEFKVRHLFLSDNSIRFESGNLGIAGGNIQFNGENLLQENVNAVLNLLGVQSFPDKDGALGGGLSNGDVYFDITLNKLAAITP